MKYLSLAGGAVCAAGVAIAVAVPLAVAPTHTAPAAASARYTQLPSGVVPRLTAIAKRADQANGGTPVLWTSVVRTTRSKAMTSATPGDFIPTGGSVTVYLITMRGRFTFTANDAPGPPGAKAPTGRYLSMVVNATTFALTDFGLSPDPPPVNPASLGPVTYLKV